MTVRACPLTGEDLPADRYVSRTATGTLRGLLTDLPGLMADLDTALARQVRFGPTGTRSTGTALAFGYEASEAGYVARQTILVWVDWVTAVRAHRVPETWAETGDYLARHGLDWVARHPDGPQVVDELTAAIRHARRAVDRPADRRYVGVCSGTTVDDDGLHQTCARDLYATAGHDTVECPTCGTVHDVEARRDVMLAGIRDRHLTAVDVARAVGGLGVNLTPDRVRQWKRRGLIRPVGLDPTSRPLYRVGDVVDLLAQGARHRPMRLEVTVDLEAGTATRRMVAAS